MNDTQVAGLCRLTVRAPARTIDLAVPADVPVADLLPAVLGYAGDDLAEQGVEHAGWIDLRLVLLAPVLRLLAARRPRASSQSRAYIYRTDPAPVGPSADFASLAERAETTTVS